MMIFGTPISWFINEIFSVVLILIVAAHICKQKKPFIKGLELIGYILGAGIFENIGVFVKVYNYSTDRILMFGKVPISILFIEGAIFYVSFHFVKKLALPKWSIPFGVGLLSSVQDMALDPACVYDIHRVAKTTLGQWNWGNYYNGGFLSIPFYNFSGWFAMMFYFTTGILLGRYFSKKIKRRSFDIAYPFLAMIFMVLLLVSPLNQFLLFAMPFAQMHQKIPELIMLILLYGISIVILLSFTWKAGKVSWANSGLVFIIPLFLDAYAIVNSIANGIKFVLPTIVIVAVLHLAYLFWAFRKTAKIRHNNP